MTLKSKNVIEKIEILETGGVQVKQAKVIMDDNKEIARTYHRVFIPASEATVSAAVAKFREVIESQLTKQG